MKVICTALWLPKKGNTEDEYEDAAAPSQNINDERQIFRCAVADGATETSFSKLWAKLLVDGFIEGIDSEQLKERWRQSVASKQLTWYAEEKAQSGAYAAVVCLELMAGSKESGSWSAKAVGDSCLIAIREGKWLLRFPLTKSEEFNSNPALLSSNLDDGKNHNEQFTKLAGNWQSGDVFYLLTDAIAHWTYKREEEHADAAFYLQSMQTRKDLEQFVAVQRELLDAEGRPLMRNDDVTLMRVALH